MSKSVTVINGVVWTQRSTTSNRNVFGKLQSSGDAPPADDKRSRKQSGAGAGQGHEGWCVYKGRDFERRTKTL